MTNRGTFTHLHPTTRKYIAPTDRGPLPERLRQLIERLHKAEPIRNPRRQRRATEKKYARADH